MSTKSESTNVVSAVLIDDAVKLRSVMDDIFANTQNWTIDSKLNVAVNGLVMSSGSIVIPLSKKKFTGNGDIIASIGDYVITMKGGRKVIVFTPEIKSAIERGDFSWADKAK